MEGATSTAISSKERSSRSPRLISDPDRDGKDTKDRAGDDGGASSPTEGTLESTSRKNSKSFFIKIGHMLRQFHKKIAIFEYNSDYSLKSSTYLNNNLFSLYFREFLFSICKLAHDALKELVHMGRPAI